MPVDRREKLVWSQEMDVDLVNFIYDRRFLWDSAHPKYRNRYVRHKTFGEFAAGLDSDYTAHGVKERWVNIRSVYSNIVRRVAQSARAGRPYEPVWHLWGPCAFLGSVRRARPRSTPSLKTPEETVEPAQGLLNRLSPSSDDLPILPRADAPSGPCAHALVDLAQLLSPARIHYLQSLQDSQESFNNVGCYVTERLLCMRPFDAECAIRKIMDILALYDEFNPQTLKT